jgi:hypothetical protein
MCEYTQLTGVQRYHIHALRKTGLTQTKMATVIWPD